MSRPHGHQLAGVTSPAVLLLASLTLLTGCYSIPTFEAYHRAAVRKRALVARPAPKATRLGDKPPLKARVWPYKFTQRQIYRARRAGCRFDAADLVRARQLHRLGYTVLELLQAYEDVKGAAGGDSNQLLAIAAYRAAGFDLKRYPGFRRSRRSLTGFFNLSIARDPSIRVLGWVLLAAGVGLIATLGGLKLRGDAELRRCERDHAGDELYECEAPGAAAVGRFIFGASMGMGGTLALTGGIVVLATYQNPLERIRKPLLDSADAATLRDFRRWQHLAKAKAAGRGTKVYLSPTVQRGGAGVLLRLQF